MSEKRTDTATTDDELVQVFLRASVTFPVEKRREATRAGVLAVAAAVRAEVERELVGRYQSLVEAATDVAESYGHTGVRYRVPIVDWGAVVRLRDVLSTFRADAIQVPGGFAYQPLIDYLVSAYDEARAAGIDFPAAVDARVTTAMDALAALKGETT